jgi:hypothetical protein
MPLKFNPAMSQWEYENPVTFDDPALGPIPGPAEPALSALAGNIVGEMPAAAQYGWAAEQALPGFADRPYLGRAVSRAYQPLLGRYLTSFPQYGGGADETTFAQWLQGQGQGQEGAPIGRIGGAYNPTTPENWADIIGVARGMSELVPYTGTGPTNAALEKWGGLFDNPNEVAALTSMMTYDPRAGSIFGRLRQAGLERQQRRFFQGTPGATAADWLGYLAGQQPETSPYFV